MTMLFGCLRFRYGNCFWFAHIIAPSSLLGMGWVPIFRFVMIQCILMTAIINILLNLLGMMTVYGRLLQIIDYILQVFVYSRFGFSQLSSLLQISGYYLVWDCNDWAHS